MCCEEIPTFYRQVKFLLRLQILPHNVGLATALPVNSVSVTTPAKRICTIFFVIWVTCPNPYVEPPLHDCMCDCMVIACETGVRGNSQTARRLQT